MNQVVSRRVRKFWVIGLLAVAVGWRGIAGPAQDLTIQAQLIWGTDEPNSPDSTKFKPVDARLSKQLQSNLRWTNYFEINRQIVAIPLGGTNSVPMSAKCRLQVKNLGQDRVELELYGQGKHISTHKEKMATDWPFILSGNATNNTAWFIVIRKVDPKIAKPKPASDKGPENATAQAR